MPVDSATQQAATYDDIVHAAQRIAPLIHTTPLLESSLLNRWLSVSLPDGQRHRIHFKAECMQTTGAFKLRGAANFIARLAERNALPKQFIANSSGNHAQAVAYAASHFGVPATIFSSKTISSVKAAATQSYGAQLKRFETRLLADAAVAAASQQPDTVWIPPYNHPDIIAGQGTATLEALQSLGSVDAVFAPCGGGGLLSGTLVAARALNPAINVIGAEPLNANDAAQSLRSGTIKTLSEAPDTLADGAATPCVGEYTFPYLQQLNHLYEVSESDIGYWTQWLHHLLKLHIEPTCCMTMQAVAEWLAQQDNPKTVVVILSGGNISPDTMTKLYQSDQLSKTPADKLAGC
ncbi:serine/threonine dehydratase [Alteromonas oceanisediminis]|uniref:serine/threonine dehydratase n=1 Tax=Alteromonas oceanisediminis TaxID=2836180 RepID=UPI001BD93EDB|nr:serine/threonine dehydratase [Alteromonas oceanisediminis]MBT0585892.1 serine/threonine dehydratase [Alteromonas oceanisediminis]